MASVVTYPHIEKPDGKPARLARMPRIRVAQIVPPYIHVHWTPEEIVLQYPHLQLVEVYAALTYYFDHKTEIDAELDAERVEFERLREEARKNPSPFVVRMRAEGRLK
jgi:uncharacterized protein (DUF433 family)